MPRNCVNESSEVSSGISEEEEHGEYRRDDVEVAHKKKALQQSCDATQGVG